MLLKFTAVLKGYITIFSVVLVSLVFPALVRSQAMPVDTQSVSIVSGHNLNIRLNAADSGSVVHIAQAGVYYAPEALYKNMSAGSIANFNIVKKVYKDKSKDTLLTMQITEKHMPVTQGDAEYDTGTLWAFSDGITVFINAHNKYLPGAFYPLVKKNNRYYYRAYNGPDPANSSLLGGLAIGLGTGFMFGNIGVGLSSSMPIMHNIGNRRLPGHHFVYMEYMMKTGISIPLQSSPL